MKSFINVEDLGPLDKAMASDKGLEERWKAFCIESLDQIARIVAEETQVMESRKPRKWFGFGKSEVKEQVKEIPVPYWHNRVTPYRISNLNSNEVFVFGSDLRGLHCGGTAYQALRNYGAVLGQGAGPQGRSYAIPTIVGGLTNIMPYVQEFIHYASVHPQQVFLVTQVGCGIAGFTPEDIAPLFHKAKDVENIHLPREFWEVIDRI